MSVTLKDVANASGVSLSTASQVLRGVENTWVSDSTKKRVRQAANTLGYRPNAAAQMLALQRKKNHTPVKNTWTYNQISEEEIWYFKTNGFYRVPHLLPEDLLERLNAVTTTQIEHTIEPIVWENTPTRTPHNVRRLSKILHRHPVYIEAATHPILLNALESILGPHIDLLTNKHNHIMVRPPSSAPVPWHSGEQPYEPTLITALVYLEESTVENGCVRIVPGSHNRPFAGPRRPEEEFEQSQWYYRSVPVPMPRGGILLFNDSCYHGSGRNRTERSRRSMTLAYRAHDAHDVIKEDPEKILVRGEKVYTGHPSPFVEKGAWFKTG